MSKLIRLCGATFGACKLWLRSLRRGAERRGRLPVQAAILAMGGLALGGAAATAIADVATLTTKHVFSNGADGGNPEASLIVGSDGNLYGTTTIGGSGSGTVFQLTPGGTLTNLHAFLNTDGSFPASALVQGSDGSFYGTTLDGGDSGTVYKVGADQSFTSLLTFQAAADFGSNPFGGLVQASGGTFYGTATSGGGTFKQGTVYSMSPAGALGLLYTFSGPDGANPFATLVAGPNGNYYGTTPFGGSGTCPATPEYTGLYGQGCGTVFMITPAGALTTLHNFNGADGAHPFAGLALGGDGNFYGTTYAGGASLSCTNGCGTVFQITPSGTFTSLHTFAANDGAEAFATLVAGSDGNLYGTTVYGGGGNCVHNYSPFDTAGCGTVFGITPAGLFLTLHAFDGTDGAYPYGGLAQPGLASLYGTTTGTTVVNGPQHLAGTAFQLQLNPPTVQIAAGAASITLGQSTALTWSSTNAISCTASGDWSGSRAVNGTQTVTPAANGTSTYTLSCSGFGGNTANASASVTVSAPPAFGGGALDPCAIGVLGLLALLRRRRH